MKHSVVKALDITSLKYNPYVSKTSKEGYIYRKIKNHPYCTKDGYYLEHRFIVEKYLKRFLSRKEVVHHINHITHDNRLENLVVYSSSGIHLREEHSIKDQFGRFTKPGKISFNIKKGTIIHCFICKKEKYVLPSRKTRFCSRSCMGIYYSQIKKNIPTGRKCSLQTKQLMREKSLQRKRNAIGFFI